MKTIAALTTLVIVLSSTVSLADEQPQVPEELAKVLAYYVGNWSVEGTLGDSPLKGRAVFRMPPGKHCIVGTVSFRVDGKPTHFSLVSGWDVSTGWSTEQGLVSDGSTYVLKWRKVSPTVDEGELVGTLGVKKLTEKDRLERKGDDEYVVVCTDRTEGDKKLPVMTLVFHRIAREKARRKSKE